MTKADPDRWCTQHHQARSQCRPSDRHVSSMRFRDDDRAIAEETARAAGSAVAEMATLAVTAMSGYIRCYRCGDPVSVQMGDLAGATLGEALFAAEKQIAAQHPAHERVLAGTGTLRAAPVPFRAPAVTR
jgi:hypothetical protein